MLNRVEVLKNILDFVGARERVLSSKKHFQERSKTLAEIIQQRREDLRQAYAKRHARG